MIERHASRSTVVRHGSEPGMSKNVREPAIRMHKIPTPKSEPYICIAGPDERLWFCESGASKIGRLDPQNCVIEEFDIPERDAMPIGITPGADGHMWFCARRANKIGRATMNGEITL